jgi:hypothetical protein
MDAVGTRPNDEPDDWLGDISDDDWSEKPSERVARGRATTAYEELPVPEDERLYDPTAARPARARPVAAAESHRAIVERRRLAAGVVLAMVLGLAILVPVLLLRDGDQSTVTTVTVPTSTTPAPTETSPAPAPGTGSTTPTTTTPTTTTPTTTTPTTTTPSTDAAAAFVLPEGTKLQREGEGDAALIRELQQALTSAGFDPGPADGTYGQRTEAAVVAFQQANGLSVDGRVGPETAEALNQALATG